MWSDRWVGLPYRKLGRGPEAFDCLGLFLALQRVRHGRALFDPLCSMTEAARARLADQVRPDWRKVQVAEEGAALLFRVRGLELHVGYALNKRQMLHACGDVGESVIEDFQTGAMSRRLEGIYVYGR